MADAPLHTVALAGVEGLGAHRFHELVDRFGSAEQVLTVGARELRDVPNVGRVVARRIEQCDLERARRIIDHVTSMGGVILTVDDHRYPTLLTHVSDPPPVLFALGQVYLLLQPCVSIVGSRDHTAYGRNVAEWLSADVARAGLVVVSGMARGIDAIAHDAALNANGHSIGILGNGLDVIYPAQNAALYRRMTERGCLVTEFRPGQRPTQGAFQARNRIISGVSLALVVVEAGPRSGTSITAGHAADQGRTVLAVPGLITSSSAWGTNRLIRDGAKPVLDADCILEEYGIERGPSLSRETVEGDTREVDDMTREEQRVLKALDRAGTSVDQLALNVAQPVGDVLATLTALELRGLVRQDLGKRFARA